MTEKQLEVGPLAIDIDFRYHAEERHITLLSYSPPGPAWKRLAKRYGKKLIHVPLSKFSQETVQQLRMFHVLNGQKIRSFAAQFIRKA